MLTETYENEASITVPPFVYLDVVRPGVMFAALSDFAKAGERLNVLLKKPFVYGPSRIVEEDHDHPYVGAVDVDPPKGNIDPAFAHGIVGVATEAAELVELLIQTWFYGALLDAVNAKEEIGDMLWYLVRIARADGVNTTLGEAMVANVAKLANRHRREPGQTFNPDADRNRDLEAERALLAAPQTPEDDAQALSEVQAVPEPVAHEKIERVGNVEVIHRIYDGPGKPVSKEEAEDLFKPRTMQFSVFHPKEGTPLLINSEGGPVREATPEEAAQYPVHPATHNIGKLAPQ